MEKHNIVFQFLYMLSIRIFISLTMQNHYKNMNIYQKWCLKKAKIKEERLFKFYKKNEKILDIGSGNCGLNFLTQESGFKIQGIDIVNKSAFKKIIPHLYDGVKLPYKNNEFDIVQLITVLHHIKDPEKTIEEAIRVGKKIIIMEDIYTNKLQKYTTFIADSINNWEFFGHPHTNKTDVEWRQIFEKNKLKIEKVEYYNFLLFFRQVTYILTKKK